MRSKRLTAFVSVLCASTAVGCGGPDGRAAPARGGASALPAPQFVPLGQAQIKAKLAGLSADVEGHVPSSSAMRPRFPARAALLFWRDVQFQDFPRAYASLTQEFRNAVPYSQFLTQIGRARGYFVADPRVVDVLFARGVATVYVAVAQGGAGRSADTLAAFNLERHGDRWLIAPDPFNTFRMPLGRTSEAVPRAKATAPAAATRP